MKIPSEAAELKKSPKESVSSLISSKRQPLIEKSLNIKLSKDIDLIFKYESLCWSSSVRMNHWLQLEYGNKKTCSCI